MFLIISLLQIFYTTFAEQHLIKHIFMDSPLGITHYSFRYYYEFTHL